MARIYTDSVVVGFLSIIRTTMRGAAIRRQRMQNRIAMRVSTGVDLLTRAMTRGGFGGRSGRKVG